MLTDKMYFGNITRHPFYKHQKLFQLWEDKDKNGGFICQFNVILIEFTTGFLPGPSQTDLKIIWKDTG